MLLYSKLPGKEFGGKIESKWVYGLVMYDGKDKKENYPQTDKYIGMYRRRGRTILGKAKHRTRRNKR